MAKRMDIKTFAKELGVSTATVSRAFGSAGRISEKTREKILKAADELGYYANYNASNLGSKKSGSICFFYPEIYTEEPDYFVSEVILGINRNLDHRQVFKVTPFDENDNRILNSCKQQILDGRVSGAIILSGTKGANILASLAEKVKIPYVIIGRNPKFTTNTVDYDNEHGAFLAGKLLKRLGRKKVAYISGHLDKLKKRGFAKGFGIEMSELITVRGGAGFRYGIQAMETLRKKYPDVDGVLCANDNLAIGLINHAQKIGVNIPKDLSVVGFDDIAFSKFCNPSLSTISLNLKELGSAAVRLLEKQMSGRDKSTPAKCENEFIQCELIIREST